MKKLLFILLSALSLTAFAQQKKVAVYVTGTNDINMSIKKIVANELVSGIVQNKDYQAIERSAEFLGELQKEQTYQRTGNVDDQQISALGKQFGVDIVCVADITPFMDSYYITARFIDVETANVIATARETSSLKTLDEFVQVTENLASKLVGVKAKEIEETVSLKEYSLVTVGDPYMTPIEIDNTGTFTKALFKFVTPVANKIIVSLDSYAQDDKTGLKYKFIGASGIVANQWTDVAPGIHEFTVTCEKMPNDLEEITIYYTKERFWKLRLSPYGKRNYYRFEDRTQELYQQAVNGKQKEVEETTISQEHINNTMMQIGQSIANATNPQYYLKITNNRLHTRVVYVDGQKIGVISGLSEKTFVVSTKYFRKIELIQKDYLISPSKEVFTNNTAPKHGDTVSVVDNPL